MRGISDSDTKIRFAMTSSSHFRQLAHLITVGDICSPFIATIDADRPAADVSVEWGVELCSERNLDPMDQIALVERGGKIQGWVGYDMLETNRMIFECTEQVTPETILTADTSLVEAVAAFCSSSLPFFLVLKGNHFIGWLSYSDLHKPPLRLCLFAMLINIERLLLDVALLSARESVGFLSEGRLSKAKEIYVIRKYNCDREGEPFSSRLLECTTVADKMSIVRKFTNIKQAVPALGERKFCSDLERLRNEIAHPGLEEGSSSLLTRERLWRFIEWAETLESELEEFLNQANIFSGTQSEQKCPLKAAVLTSFSGTQKAALTSNDNDNADDGV